MTLWVSPESRNQLRIKACNDQVVDWYAHSQLITQRLVNGALKFLISMLFAFEFISELQRNVVHL